MANQKLEMNGSKAQGRALANGRDGHVLLGGLTLPEGVLHGKGLRALMDAQQQVAPVGGLIQGKVGAGRAPFTGVCELDLEMVMAQCHWAGICLHRRRHSRLLSSTVSV